MQLLKDPQADRYIQAAVAGAQFEVLHDGTVFGTIPGFQGVWANAPTSAECAAELPEVLEGWLSLRLEFGLLVPTVG